MWAEVHALLPSEQDFEAGLAKGNQLVLPCFSWHRAARLEIGTPEHVGINMDTSCSSLTFGCSQISGASAFCLD